MSENARPVHVLGMCGSIEFVSLAHFALGLETVRNAMYIATESGIYFFDILCVNWPVT